MSRFRRITHGIASGYLSLIAATIYALALLPLAFHYLSKEQFALWAIMSSIAGYLNLIDLGMSGSVARLLIDHKDDRDGEVYGSLIKTGWLVLWAQASIIFLVGLLGAPVVSWLLAIKPEVNHEFVLLLRWQCTWLGINFGMRMFSQLLNAHQRMDIVNYSQTCLFAVSFSAQGCFFHRGSGVFSLVWGQMVSLCANITILCLACRWLGFFPARGKWGSISWSLFREMFLYGKDLFLVALGTQLIVASQTMIITRRLGLETAGIWAAGTRAFSQVCQAISRIIAVSIPALSEMIVRGEQGNLRARFKDVTILSASVGGFCAVTFAACNSLFVHIVTHGKVDWPVRNDVLLAIWMVLLSVLGCHNNLVIAIKDVRFMRYIYFIEGLVFVALSWFVSAWGGLSGIIGCSILCTSVFTFSYGLRRTSHYFQISESEVGVSWVMPAFRVICVYGPIAALAWVATASLNDYLHLGIMCAVAVLFGIPILLFQGLPSPLRNEMLSRSSQFFKISLSRN